MKSYLAFAVLFLASFFCSISFAQKQGDWEGFLKVSPALVLSEEGNQVLSGVSFGSRYFLTDRIRADLGLQIDDGFTNDVTFSPGFRYYYRKQEGSWNLMGGLSLDAGLFKEHNLGRPLDLIATPIEAEFHLFRGLYLNLAVSYRKALEEVRSGSDGFQPSLGFMIRF